MKKKKDKNTVGSWRWWKPWTWFRKRSSKMYDEHNEGKDVGSIEQTQNMGKESEQSSPGKQTVNDEDVCNWVSDDQQFSSDVLTTNQIGESSFQEGETSEAGITLESVSDASSQDSDVPQPSDVPEPSSNTTSVPSTTIPQASSLSLAIKIELDKCLTKADFSAIRTFYEKIYNFNPHVGKVKERYFEQLDFTQVVIPYFESITLEKSEGFEEIGLECKFNPKEGVLVIQGTPKKGYDGVIEIKVNCHVKEKRFTDDKNFKLKGEFIADLWTCKAPILINPDPWELWDDRPAPEDGDYWKKDSAKDSATLSDSPQITLLCASQRGRSHAQESKFRDDHFLCDVAQTPDQWSFIAVADGAGSAKFSREGSRIACETLVTAMKPAFCDLDKRYAKGIDEALRQRWSELSQGTAPQSGYEALDDGALTFVPKPSDDPNQETKPIPIQTLLYSGVHKFWTTLSQTVADYNAPQETEDPNASRVNKKKPDEKDATIKDYSTTLLFAAVKRFPETETSKAFWAIITYWVGDGGLAIYRPNGRDAVIPMGAPDAGEYAGQTRFITMREEIDPAAVAKRVKVAFVEDFKALALMTDGLTDPFFPAESDLGKNEYWRTFWNETLQGKDERVHRFEPNDSQDFIGVLDKTRTAEDRAQSLLDGLMFKVKGNHDDRTIALLINDDMSDEVPAETEDQPKAPNELDQKSLNIEKVDSSGSSESVDGGDSNGETPNDDQGQFEQLPEQIVLGESSASDALSDDELPNDDSQTNTVDANGETTSSENGDEKSLPTEDKSETPNEQSQESPPSDNATDSEES